MEISQKKLHSWFRRWDYGEKVPGPMAEKTALQAQEAWKKGAIGSLTGGGNKFLSPIKGRLPLRGKVCPVL